MSSDNSKMKKLLKIVSGISVFHVIIFILPLFYGCATPSILVTSEQKMGDDLFNRHDYAGAINHYEATLDASKKLGVYRNTEMESDVNRKIADCYVMNGDYTTALSHVKIAMGIDSIGKKLLSTIEDYRQEGKIYIYQGAYNRSIRSLDKALLLSQDLDQSIKGIHQQAIADNYLALGQLNAILGKSQIAIDNLQKSMELFKLSRDRNGEMEANLAMGSVYSDYGYFDIAGNYINKSIDLATGQKLGTARQNQLVASLLSSQGEYEEALKWQKNALSEANRNKITGQIIWSNIGTGDIYKELNDLEKAKKYYKTALQVKDSLSSTSTGLKASLDLRIGDIVNARSYFSSQGSSTGEAISLLRIAEIMLVRSEPDSAMFSLDRAELLFKGSVNLQGIAQSQLLKGKICSETGRFMEGIHLLDSVLKYSDFPELLWQAWFYKGNIYESQGELENARDSYLNSVSVIEKIRGKLSIDEFKSSYFRNKIDVYDRLIRLLLRMNKNEEAFQISEKARSRAFYDIMAGRRINFRGAMPGDLTLLEQMKRNEIEKLYKLIQQEGSISTVETDARRQAETRSALEKVQEEYEDILQKIKLENPEYREIISAEPVKLKDLQAKIDNGTAVISYWVGESELIIWFVTGSQIIMKSVEIDRQVLKDFVEKTRNAIKSNALKNSSESLKKLSSILITPLSSEISSVKNLVIIPNGCLHFIPFQALVTENGVSLVEKHNISYIPSASVFVLNSGKIPTKGSKFLGMALGDIYVGNNPGLPGTSAELERIKPMFTDKTTTDGEESTETFARKNCADFNFIHFATHGIYDYKQPLYSFLLFPPSESDDGRLNVWEVFEMDLHSKLVTLSACETGLGNLDQGDEIIGLSRAFLYAGSSAVIVSLWSVADYPTAILMSYFYKYIHDHSLEEALTMAQKEVIKQYPQPMYWAPFILIGNGKTLAD
jgi:CHAT domain-containing protein/Tfp pilus assembly protein PilF